MKMIMKKILRLIAFFLITLSQVQAGEHGGGFHGGGGNYHSSGGFYHGGGEHHEYHGGGFRGGYGYYPYYYGSYYYDPFGSFVFPALIGGAIGYELAQPNQQTIIVQQPPMLIQGQASNGDTAPPGFHTEAIKDANCNCYRNVIVKNF
jgi:hypothetical protein